MNQFDVAAKTVSSMTTKALDEAIKTLCDKGAVYSDPGGPKRDVPAYEQVRQMGDKAVGPLLAMLKDRPPASTVLMYLLRDITGAQPVHDRDRGDVAAMESAWIRWGRNRKIIS